jgi:3-deoxy-D-manno-octulosonic-acid transferase
MGANISTLPFGLRAYQALTGLGAGFVGLVLRRRAGSGKEDPDRLEERFGKASRARPEGRLVWLHGASIGESLVAWTMGCALQAATADLQVLLTTGTRTSASMIGRRISDGYEAGGLPFIHQYLPADTPDAAQRFLDHWRPDLAVFVEGDIWPNLLLAARDRGCPTALINARMTEKSLKGWGRMPASARTVFGSFDLIHAADAATAAGLERVNGTKPALGPSNLKLAAPAAQIDPAALKALRAQIGSRPVWLAASTHQGEEKLVVAAHALLQIALPDLLLILAPRHPDRVADVRVTCTLSGMTHASRSTGDFVSPTTEVLIWDTLGELSVAFAAVPVTVLAGSLLPDIGGHNPVEPLQAGSAVITGPFGYNFADIFGALQQAGGIRVLDHVSADTIAMAVAGLLGDRHLCEPMVEAGRAVVAAGANGQDRVRDCLLGLLAKANS